ncbi:hypothetical protein GEMRC1_003407 [Eukaryota sp. GEM-RC1]
MSIVSKDIYEGENRLCSFPPIKTSRCESPTPTDIVQPRISGNVNTKGQRVRFAPESELVEIHDYHPDPNEWVVIPETALSDGANPQGIVPAEIVWEPLVSLYPAGHLGTPPEHNLTDTLSALLSSLGGGFALPIPNPVPQNPPFVHVAPPPLQPKPIPNKIVYSSDNPFPRSLYPESQLPYDVRGPDFTNGLFQKARSNKVRPCHFFSGKKGCRRGDVCPYIHDPSLRPPFADFLFKPS